MCGWEIQKSCVYPFLNPDGTVLLDKTIEVNNGPATFILRLQEEQTAKKIRFEWLSTLPNTIGIIEIEIYGPDITDHIGMPQNTTCLDVYMHANSELELESSPEFKITHAHDVASILHPDSALVLTFCRHTRAIC